MRDRRVVNRRQTDRLLKHRFELSVITAALVIVGGLSIMKACTSDGPTAPSPVAVPAPQPGPAPASGAPQTAVPEEPQGNNPGAVSIVCDGVGNCMFSNTGKAGHKVSAACTRPGDTNDWGSWTSTVPVGQDTESVSVYDICDPVKIGIDLCEGGEQKVQVDFTAGSGEHIGHWGLGSGKKLVYEANEEYCECKPSDWEITHQSEPREGEPVECPVEDFTVSNNEGCFECFEVLTDVVESNGCDKRERTISTVGRREVECPCEVEWTPQEPVIEITHEYGEWSVCTLPEVLALNNEEVCFGTRFRSDLIITTTTTTLTNQCDEETKQEVEVTREQSEEVEPCETECPIPGLCYYNVKGKNGKEKCEGTPGFNSWNEENHLCALNFPGISDKDFNLNPGQSVEGCLSKHDD